MPKIVNERYKELIEKGTINLFDQEELQKGLLQASKSKFGNQARAFLIALYYTGARPVELLQLKPTNFKEVKTYIHINIPTAKRGVPRVVSIPKNKKFATELFNYTKSVMDEVYLFYDLISYKTRHYTNKEGIQKQYIIITDRVYYYINKWIGVNPYFLRHSRMSALSQSGADLRSLMQFKGSKSMDSIRPYLHMSTQESQKLGRMLK